MVNSNEFVGVKQLIDLINWGVIVGQDQLVSAFKASSATMENEQNLLKLQRKNIYRKLKKQNAETKFLPVPNFSHFLLVGGVNSPDFTLAISLCFNA